MMKTNPEAFSVSVGLNLPVKRNELEETSIASRSTQIGSRGGKQRSVMKYAIEIRSAYLSFECTQFAADLMKAYSRWCDRRSFRANIVQDVEAEFGFKEAILFIDGDASALLKENGFHRKLAYSDFEANQKIHASSCQVNCYKLDPSKEQVLVRFERKGASAGGAVYRPDILIATSDFGTLTFDVTRNRVEEAKENAIAIFSSRTQPNSQLIRTWRFHPANQFYVKDLTDYNFSTEADVARFFDGEF